MQEYCFNNELIEIRKYIALIESLLPFFFFFLLYNIFTIRDYGSRFRLLASSLASLGFSLGSFRTTGQNLISHPPRWTIIAISMLSLSLPMTFPPGVKFSSFVLLHGFSRWGKLFGKLQIFHRSRESIEILFHPKQILLVSKNFINKLYYRSTSRKFWLF